MLIIGYILWYDASSDDGILSDLNGNEYYFNSWSFSKTHYEVTGKSKKTGLIKTVKTRLFPGLFLAYNQIKDPICTSLKTNTPVLFKQAEGINRAWAVSIKVAPQHKKLVLENRLVTVLDSIISLDNDPREWYRKNWEHYYHSRIDSLLNELSAA